MIPSFFVFGAIGATYRKEVITIRTPVSRVGNKTALLPILCARFPLKFDTFVDLFGGSGSVLLGKPMIAKKEVYNDFDRNLVNLFRCMKQRPMAVIRELDFCHLNSRDDFNVMVKFLQHEQFDDAYMEEELQLTEIMLPEPSATELILLRKRIQMDYDVRLAAIFLKSLRLSYASTGKSFAARPFDIRKLFWLIQQMEDRLAPVVIENQDFEICARNHDSPSTFIYADPPYFSSEYMYGTEFNWADHLRLRDLAKSLKGKIMISYNDCPQIREIYSSPEFHFYAFERTHSMAQKAKPGEKFPELLITNYDMDEREKAKPKQLTMFDMAGNLMDEYDTFDYERILQNRFIPIAVDKTAAIEGSKQAPENTDQKGRPP